MHRPEQQTETPGSTRAEKAPAPRPAYEPPRIVKKRSVSRATLFSGSGGGPAPGGLVGTG